MRGLAVHLVYLLLKKSLRRGLPCFSADLESVFDGLGFSGDGGPKIQTDFWIFIFHP